MRSDVPGQLLDHGRLRSRQHRATGLDRECCGHERDRVANPAPRRVDQPGRHDRAGAHADAENDVHENIRSLDELCHLPSGPFYPGELAPEL